MTPLERAARALAENLKAQADRLGFVATDTERYPVLDGCFDMQDAARAVLEAIREPQEGEDRVMAIQRRVMVDELLRGDGDA